MVGYPFGGDRGSQMNSDEFVARLVAGTVPNLRPDGDFVREFQEEARRKHIPESKWELVLEQLRGFRMFPSIADLDIAIRHVMDTLRADASVKVMWQTFTLGDKNYARRVEVAENGMDLVFGKDLPEAAVIGGLAIPPNQEAHDYNAISYEQAIAEGLVDFRAAVIAEPKRKKESKTERVSEVIGGQFSDYDDSPQALGEIPWEDV
jgi:hypothetical protein